MKRSIVALLLVALTLPAFGGAAQSAAPTSLQAALDARTGAVPGTAIVVGIIDNGRVTTYLSGSTGNARPLDAHTLFEIGSVSKTFTATILASMARAGQVALNDPIAKYLPSGVRVPSKDGRQITLLNVAEQRSGLPRMPTNMSDETGDDPYADYGTKDMYAFLDGYALTRDPGAKYEYSNYGIGLLGQALAYRAKMSYPALLKQRVLDPLHMNETSVATMPASDPATFAVGHDMGGNAVHAWHFASIAPAGGIRSNLVDMLKYLRCNMGVGPLAKDCLFAQRPRANGEVGHKIGLVWWSNPTSGIVSHGGDTAGFHAFVAVSGDRRKGVVVMSNGPAVDDIAAHVLVPSYPIAMCPSGALPASQSDPVSYVGVYCNAISATVFRVAAGKAPKTLSIALEPQPAFVYAEIQPDAFYQAKYRALIKFSRQNGKIVGLTLEQNGQSVPCVRLDARGKPMVAALPSGWPAIVTLPISNLKEYVGTYNSSVGKFFVTLEGTQIYGRLTGQPTFAAYPSAKDEFFLKAVDAQVSFTRDSTGRINGFVLHQGGQNVTATLAPP